LRSGRRSERIVADSVDEARSQLQASCPGVAVSPGIDGRFRMELQTDYLSGMVTHLFTTTTGGKFRFPNPHDGYLLAALDEGAVEVEIEDKWWERRAPGVVMADAARATRWRWQPGRYEMLVVDADSLHHRLALLLERPIVTRVRFDLDVPAHSPGIKFAREIARVARLCTSGESDEGPGCSEQALRHLQDALMYAVLDSIPNNYTAHLSRQLPGPSPRHVRRAIEFIHAHAMQPVTLEEIAKSAHVSIRALQTGFANFKGTTPMAYLKQIRLEGVHAELSRADNEQAIAEIARRWCFGHMGLFARSYRKAFGQTPSEARRTSRVGNG
jgi:AraC-like DNA-binding protein